MFALLDIMWLSASSTENNSFPVQQTQITTFCLFAIILSVRSSFSFSVLVQWMQVMTCQ